MVKHHFEVVGVNMSGIPITGSCIAPDIIVAIELFRALGANVHSIRQTRQAHADAAICITNLTNGTPTNAIVYCYECTYRKEHHREDAAGNDIIDYTCNYPESNLAGMCLGNDGFCSAGVKEIL